MDIPQFICSPVFEYWVVSSFLVFMIEAASKIHVQMERIPLLLGEIRLSGSGIAKYYGKCIVNGIRTCQTCFSVRLYHFTWSPAVSEYSLLYILIKL